jgi:hypothetical protein
MLLGFLLGAVVVGWLVYLFARSRRYSRMYSFLKDRVMEAEDKTLNVTHALTDLENRFGPIDEEGWGRINDLRASDKKIGFYEDDFLYWKAS